MKYKDFLISLLYDDATVANSQYGLLGALGDVLTISFTDQVMAGRAPNSFKGYPNRNSAPNFYAGWKSNEDTPLEIHYDRSPGWLNLLTTALQGASAELARVSGVNFQFTNENNDKAKINWHIHGDFIPKFTNATAGQTVVDEDFQSSADNFSIISFRAGKINFEDTDGLQWLSIHELIHSFGFKDIQLPDVGGPVDQQSATVMSYNAVSGHARATLSIADIYALQQLVGANTTQNVADGSVYNLKTLSYTTIWDAGGDHDRIDASGLEEGQVIDLRQGTTSSHKVGGYEVGIAYGAVIEDATGSGHDDVIIGNAAANEIRAGDGADYIFGDAAALKAFKQNPGSFIGATRFFDPQYYTVLSIDASVEDVTQVVGVAAATPATRLKPDVLDGGDGNDFIFAKGGQATTTIGGAGRDYIYNNTMGGVIYGDSIDGVGTPDTSENADKIVFAPGVTLMDAGKYDILVTSSGSRLTGGIDSGQRAGGKVIYNDKLLEGISYVQQGKDLLIIDKLGMALNKLIDGIDSSERDQAFVVHNFDVEASTSGWGFDQIFIAQRNKLGLSFKTESLLEQALKKTFSFLGFSALTASSFYELVGLSLVDLVFTKTASLVLDAKAALWVTGIDPLVLDLDGDGIEFSDISDSNVYFDLSENTFAVRTGWVKGDDGFLVRDLNGNGRIDDAGEMFGGRFASGLDALAAFDGNNDGVIDAADALWADLKVWRDLDSDGFTDAGELKSLGETGILSISLAKTALDVTTPQGARILGRSDVTFAGGIIRKAFDAVFETSDSNTKYAGEAGRAAWSSSRLDAKGFGRITNLSVAMANDPGLEALASTTAAAMTAVDLQTLTRQAGVVLGKWGSSLEQSRELYAVRVSLDGKTLLERAVWDGSVLGAGWRLEQGWSPSDRAAPLTSRQEAPYLMRVEGGRYYGASLLNTLNM